MAASSSTGDRGIACATGELSTLECGPTGIAVTTAKEVYWKVCKGAVLVQRVGSVAIVLYAEEQYYGKTVKVLDGVITCNP